MMDSVVANNDDDDTNPKSGPTDVLDENWSWLSQVALHACRANAWAALHTIFPISRCYNGHLFPAVM